MQFGFMVLICLMPLANLRRDPWHPGSEIREGWVGCSARGKH